MLQKLVLKKNKILNIITKYLFTKIRNYFLHYLIKEFDCIVKKYIYSKRI